MDPDIEVLSAQVKVNCDISDARFWGTYSICGLLLRLRELFSHENGMRPWQEIPQEVISEWIAAKENLWREIEEREFVDLMVEETSFPPFEIEGINHVLKGKGVVYGAGLGILKKPSFFLAELLRRESLCGYEVNVSGRELVRDLSSHPAMLLGKTIFARRDALAAILWSKFEEMRLKKYKGSLLYAFSQYGIAPQCEPDEALYIRLLQIAEAEIPAYIHHEIGEAREGMMLGEQWRQMLSGHLSRRAELFVRSIKDLLSDMSESGMLKYVIEHTRRGSLGFYLSSLGGLRTLILPQMQELFPDFIEKEDWLLVEKIRKEGYGKAHELASSVLSIFDRQGEGASEVIEKELLEKLLARQ